MSKVHANSLFHKVPSIFTIALLCLLWVAPRLGAAPKSFRLEAGKSCLDCHAVLAQQPVIHAATESGKGCTTLCHQQTDPATHLFSARPKPISSLCAECHDDQMKEIHKHPPAAEGDCSACHNPHQSKQKKLLTLPAAELCLQCHDSAPFAGRSIHGPVTAGQCAACHNPHSSPKAKLLRESGAALCFRCHDKELEDLQKIKLPATKRLFEDKKAKLHPPFAAGDCSDCHRPHASSQARLLGEAFPAGLYQTYSEAAYTLCLNCHDAGAFAEPRTLSATSFRNGNLNLHQRHVNRDKGRSCRACHNPHGSYQPHLVTELFRFGKRNLGIGFESSDNGGSCVTSCHVKVTYDRLVPVNNPLRTTPRQGSDATPEELEKALPAKKATPESSEKTVLPK